MHLIRVKGKPCGLYHLVGSNLGSPVEEEKDDDEDGEGDCYKDEKEEGDGNKDGNGQMDWKNEDLGSPSIQERRWYKA